LSHRDVHRLRLRALFQIADRLTAPHEGALGLPLPDGATWKELRAQVI
jgi:hypothetical protein